MRKQSFKKIPVWEFEEVYLQDPQPRETTCPQSLRNSQDPVFKAAFIPNVQLFMHREHLNISEWNRLAHFNNPFGFMGYNYKVVKQAVDLIPKLKDYQLLPVPTADKQGCIRCAVVANGGILNGSGMGKEIDSHDYVFRMNGAVTTGHEDDVGKKTSVYVHTAHSLISSLTVLRNKGFRHIPLDKDIKYVLIPEGSRDYNFLESLYLNRRVPKGDYRGRTPRSYYSNHFNESRFYVLHPDFLRYVRNRFLRARRLQFRSWWMYRPTNGAFTLFLALHVCDVVHAYGFSTANHRKYPNYYYDQKHTRMVFYINHDYVLEMLTWKRLHDMKVIKLFQRDEEDTQMPGGSREAKQNG
ncbi:hypothetical protein MATL_G00007030 [Megalops atlanticus]|uniref:alpha-N-acetylgalactosaminide alpha-2,6-sialyltransferase n=1 Tax=Megalops atlanticus TaxID=7932 RepID=A0A9D3QJG4_MEGAT|nr:hypothetical protein MATL_G00007030 [Megalops atlanticus]